MKFLLVSVIATPVIFLLIALALALLPVQRSESDEGLDFEMLKVIDTSEYAFVESNYVARDGSELFYRAIEGGADTVIVLIHGSGAEGRYLLSLATKLNKSLDATVVVPDLRGHGKSSLSNLGDVSYKGQFEHDLEDLQSALRTNYLDANFFLGGHSSGGGLALKYGGNESAKFNGYLLLAPYMGYGAPTVRPESGNWVQVSTRRYAGLTMLNKVGIHWFNDREVLFFNRPKEFDDELQAKHYTYRLNESFSPNPYRESLEKNRKPMLVLVGQDDEAFYSDKFEAVFNEHAPLAQVSLIPRLKHLDLPSDQTTANMMTNWIQETSE